MSSFREAVATARAAWLSNYTLGDQRWPLKQLHGLHKLVMKNRDAIVEALAREHSQPAFIYEREIAILVKQVCGHISLLESKPKRNIVQSTLYGESEIIAQPCGVSLIVSGSDNFIRFGLAPLAASIAARNVVILATSLEQTNPVIVSLLRDWSKFLDVDTVHLLAGIQSSEIVIEEVDHVVIFDSSENGYSNITQSPKVDFYPVPIGSNFAIIGNGPKNWHDIALEVIAHSTDQKLPSDRLSAVFVLKEDMDEFHEAMKKVQSMDTNPSSVQTRTPKLPAGNILRVQPPYNLQVCLERAESSAILLLVAVSSLDEAIDLLNNSSISIHQLSMFAAESKIVTEYVKNWVRSDIFCVGCIPAIATPIFSNSSPENAPTHLLFPASLFSRPRLVIQNASESRPAGTITTSIPQIRASYDALIKPLKPEPRGERIGFFDQVDYLVRGLMAVVGVLGVAGLYVGGRAVRRRW